jgi:hypothetical protein
MYLQNKCGFAGCRQNSNKNSVDYFAGSSAKKIVFSRGARRLG